MKRLFWLGAGAVVGAVVVHRTSVFVRSFAPAGDGSLGEGMRELTAVVREAMAQRETELRVALGVDTGTLDPDRGRDLLRDPGGRTRDASRDEA